MKRILGLDLGTNSIGWALVNEAETDEEVSSIIRLGVRVNPLTVDETQNFEKGKSITTNAERTLKIKEVCAVICSDINYVVMRWLNF